jgi:hypothetical protein
MRIQFSFKFLVKFVIIRTDPLESTEYVASKFFFRVFRRLNRTERLRASSPYQRNRQSTTKPAKEKVKKVMEFALLRCWPDDEEEDEPHHLKWPVGLSPCKWDAYA